MPHILEENKTYIHKILLNLNSHKQEPFTWIFNLALKKT